MNKTVFWFWFLVGLNPGVDNLPHHDYHWTFSCNHHERIPHLVVCNSKTLMLLKVQTLEYLYYLRQFKRLWLYNKYMFFVCVHLYYNLKSQPLHVCLPHQLTGSYRTALANTIFFILISCNRKQIAPVKQLYVSKKIVLDKYTVKH